MFNLTNRFLWQAIAWTFPLFIFGDFRLNLGFYHISIPSLLLLLIFVNYLFQQISSGEVYLSITSKSYELMTGTLTSINLIAKILSLIIIFFSVLKSVSILKKENADLKYNMKFQVSHF